MLIEPEISSTPPVVLTTIEAIDERLNQLQLKELNGKDASNKFERPNIPRIFYTRFW